MWPPSSYKYQAGRVVIGGFGTVRLEMGYRGSWSPGHGRRDPVFLEDDIVYM